MKVINDITYFKENKLDIYLPDKNCFSTVIYFHGGGIVGGDKQEYREHGEFLAERGICFVSANYSFYFLLFNAAYRHTLNKVFLEERIDNKHRSQSNHTQSHSCAF